jgi:hypothetical protein
MQSDPIEVSQNTTINYASQQSPNNSQHGQHHLPDHGSGHLIGRHAGDQSHRHVGTASDVSSDISSQADEELSLRLRRLSSHSSSKDWSPVDRINEYENAQATSPGRDGQIGFMVIPSQNKGNPGRSIENFPNGKQALVKDEPFQMLITLQRC